MRSFFVTLSIVFLSSFCALAQQKTPVNFGKVIPEDFVIPSNTVTDSSTSAVIIADLGSTTFKGNDKGWVSYIFKRKTRIKILNKKAFELATVKIPLYTEDENREKLENISATSYNLENGTVVATKMEKSDLFADRIDKNRVEQKFTLPAVKENTIIEYSYTVYSDFYFNIPEWSFQNIDYPCLWSEYEVNIPSLVGYIFTKRGVHPFYIDKADDGHENYLIKRITDDARGLAGNDMMSISANTVKHRWVMKDVPAFYVENYLFAAENYIDKIDFQLAQTFDGETVHPVKNTWTKATEDMLNDKDFAGFTTNPDGNAWLDKSLNSIVKASDDQLQQAKDIYYYLTNNFTCTGYHSKYIKTTLQDVVKNRKGNVGEINLLLTDMLLRKQITAAPVVLSTREFGYNYASYPVLSRLDYVICKVTIGDKVYYLDASRPTLGFGHLPPNCYNGHARVIGMQDSASVYFLADSLKELQNIMVNIINDPDGKAGLVGSYNNSPGYMDSYSIRASLSEGGQKKYFDNLQSAAGDEFQITETGIDSLKDPEKPVKVHADFSIKTGTNDIIYFNPVLWGDFKTNPFSKAVRKYPVEMPYPLYQVYSFIMETPAGFVIDEMPKSAKVSFNGGEGYFEYLVQQTDGLVQLRSTISMKKAYFDPDEYNTLRDFFGYIVKKQSEQIVFKKKK